MAVTVRLVPLRNISRNDAKPQAAPIRPTPRAAGRVAERGLADVLLTPAMVPPAVLLVSQQLIVASSTIWLTRLAMGVGEGRPVACWLLCYLASLVLPYVPGTILYYTLDRWSLDAQARLLSLVDGTWYGRVMNWHDAKQRGQILSLYSKEAPRLMDEFVRYAYSLSSGILNALLNMLALALVVEPKLLCAYGFSLVLVFAIIRWQAPINEQLADSAQQNRLQYSDRQLGMWDNTLLGNTYNHAAWYAGLTQSFSAMRGAVLKASRFGQSITLLIIFGTQIPVLSVLCWELFCKPVSSARALALVVTLPRLLQIINTSHEVLTLIAMWHLQKGKSRILSQLFVPGASPAASVSYELLRVNDRPVGPCGNVDEFVAALELPGRITVTGPNGAGKTTLLLQLKSHFGNRALYFPAKHGLAFQSTSERASTGQVVLAQLDEIIQSNASPVLLLDEWDANLDMAHQREMDHRFARLLSRGVAVIEVRHRKSLIETGTDSRIQFS